MVFTLCMVQAVLSKGSGPDAYGPFWLSMTLVFILSVTSNVDMWLNISDDVNFASDLNALFTALWVVFSFSFGIPLISYFALDCLGGKDVNVSFMQLFSLYGYSLATFLPATALCVIPSLAVQWLSLLTATAFSTGLIMRNLVGPIMQADQKSARALLGWFAGCQLILLFVLKLCFYNH